MMAIDFATTAASPGTTEPNKTLVTISRVLAMNSAVDVAGFAVAPGVEHFGSEGDHGLGVHRDIFLAEGGLN